MKLHYYAETDSLYIDLASAPSKDSREISDGLVAEYDEHAESSKWIFNVHPSTSI